MLPLFAAGMTDRIAICESSPGVGLLFLEILGMLSSSPGAFGSRVAAGIFLRKNYVRDKKDFGAGREDQTLVTAPGAHFSHSPQSIQP